MVLGAIVGLMVMTGAITFHLLTPLGISVKNIDGTYDGGQLFYLAVCVWLSCLTLVCLNCKVLKNLINK